jgi:hypothetical protein
MLTALSNKSMITRRLMDNQDVSGLPASEFGTLALNTLALKAGTRLLRVHTPRLAKILLDLLYPFNEQ